MLILAHSTYVSGDEVVKDLSNLEVNQELQETATDSTPLVEEEGENEENKEEPELDSKDSPLDDLEIKEELDPEENKDKLELDHEDLTLENPEPELPTAEVNPKTIETDAQEPLTRQEDSIPVSSMSELNDAIRDAPTNSEPTIIEIVGSFDISSVISIRSGQNIIIQSSTERTITQTQSSLGASSRHFNVLSGSSLTLKGSVILTSSFKDQPTDFYGGGVVVSGTFIMDGGTISYNSTFSTHGGGVLIEPSGHFIMNNGIISHNKAGIQGGGVRVNGTLDMNDGTISHNESLGGGGVDVNGGEFNMQKGTISDNTSLSNGGGVNVLGDFNMISGTISQNKAYVLGAGVHVVSGGAFTMDNGFISFNELVNLSDGSTSIRGNGGGVSIASGGSFIMNNGTINENEAFESGGGVNVQGTFEMHRGSITGNQANGTFGNGGGIHVTNLAILENIVVGEAVEFSDNEAHASFEPPFNVRTAFPNIRATTSSVASNQHPLNNLDIGLPPNTYSNRTLMVTSNLGMDPIQVEGQTIPETGVNIWAGTDVLIVADSVPGYNFIRWDSVQQLDDETSQNIRFTMPNSPTTLTAIYQEKGLILNIPSELIFEETKIQSGSNIIHREIPNWSLTVTDERATPGSWQLTASADHFISTDGARHTLDNALVFIKEDDPESPYHLNKGSVIIAEEAIGQEERTVYWEPHEGLLLDIPAEQSNVRATKYVTTINWELRWAPPNL